MIQPASLTFSPSFLYQMFLSFILYFCQLYNIGCSFCDKCIGLDYFFLSLSLCNPIPLSISLVLCLSIGMSFSFCLSLCLSLSLSLCLFLSLSLFSVSFYVRFKRFLHCFYWANIILCNTMKPFRHILTPKKSFKILQTRLHISQIGVGINYPGCQKWVIFSGCLLNFSLHYFYVVW